MERKCNHFFLVVTFVTGKEELFTEKTEGRNSCNRPVNIFVIFCNFPIDNPVLVRYNTAMKQLPEPAGLGKTNGVRWVSKKVSYSLGGMNYES